MSYGPGDDEDMMEYGDPRDEQVWRCPECGDKREGIRGKGVLCYGCGSADYELVKEKD